MPAWRQREWISSVEGLGVLLGGHGDSLFLPQPVQIGGHRRGADVDGDPIAGFAGIGLEGGGLAFGEDLLLLSGGENNLRVPQDGGHAGEADPRLPLCRSEQSQFLRRGRRRLSPDQDAALAAAPLSPTGKIQGNPAFLQDS